MTLDGANIRQAWHRFWQDSEMARNHHRALSIFSVTAIPRDVFLDLLLPTQLFVHLISVLDEGLEAARGDRPFPPG